MFVLNLFFGLLTLVFVVYSASIQSPDCDVDKHACVCPAGTQYMECTTRAVIGATVPDVRVLTGDCESIAVEKMKLEKFADPMSC